MTCRTCTGVSVRRTVHGTVRQQTYGVCRCGLLINIEYRAISGHIHRLYFAGLINSSVFFTLTVSYHTGKWIVLGSKTVRLRKF